MKKYLIIIIASLILSSCAHDSISSNSTSNPDGMKVELMFHLDSTFVPGVYRFSDGGYYKYFVISPYGDSRTISVETHGKVVVSESIETK